MSFFVTFLIFSALTVAGELLRPKPTFENARPSSLGDFQLPTATQDRVVPVLVGTVRQRGLNSVWYGDLQARPITETVKTGIFSKTSVVRGFEYDLGIQYAACRGVTEDVELLRFWVGEDEIYSGSIPGEGSFTVDLPELFGDPDTGGGGGIRGTITWRPGSTTQTVPSYLSSGGFQAVGGVTLRYTGTAYVLFERVYVGNSTNIRPVSCEIRRIPNGLGLGVATVNSGDDANPMNWAYEILTNQEWGFARAAATIDTTSFTTAATTLASEGNGVSMLIDAERDAQEFLDEVERQIDGAIFLDHRTGKWKCNLARGGYDIDTIPQLTSPVNVSRYEPGDWTDTTNVVIVSFSNRADDYVGDNAVWKNPANVLMQGDGTVAGGRTVPSVERYPGIKDGTLAAKVAARDGRTLSRPLITAEVEVTREFWDVEAWEVIAWTSERHEDRKIAFRVREIDYGSPKSPGIKMSLVEDIFVTPQATTAAPGATKWTAPQSVPSALATADQLAFECPRGIATRSGLPGALVWCSARRGSFATKFDMVQRNDSGTPSGSFVAFGESFGFMLVGELKSALDAGTTIPSATIDLVTDPDSQADLEAAFTDSTNVVDLGQNLVNLILIGDPNVGEFALAMSAAVSGADVRLSSVYRGVLDTAQQDHASGTKVYLVFAGGNVGDDAIPETNECEVKLLPASPFGAVAEGSATAITIENPGGDGLDKRRRRPYSPGEISLGGSPYPSTASLEGAGSGAEGVGFDLEFVRRDYRTGDVSGDEVEALTTDAASLFADFPSANSTTVEVEVIDDPDGSPTSLFTDVGISAASHVPFRIDVLAQTDGVLPTRVRVSIAQRHDEGPDSGLLSRYEGTHDFDVTSALTGDFNFGARSDGVTSNTYTADAAGQHDFVLSTALPGGEDVEYQLNGGGWLQLIAGGGTTGAIAGVSISDTIEVRHQGSASSIRKQLTMTAPVGGTDGYFILVE